MQRIAVYLFMFAVFFTATSELVVAGILPELAGQMRVSLALAGQLVTIYSLAFAVGTPLIVTLTARLGRKKLLLATLVVFIAGNLASFASPGFAMLAAARVLLGASSGVLMVAAFGAAAKLVPAERLGSAIGTIVLGFSSAMVAGVPIGIALTERFGWQAIFLLLAVGSLPILLAIAWLLPETEGDAPVPLLRQIAVARDPVIRSALLLVLFREAGNSIMFAYAAAFLGDMLHRTAGQIGAIMLAFGIAGAIGSRLGGAAVDRWGSARLIVGSVSAHVLALALLPLAVGSPPLAIAFMALWVLAMFVMGPATQTYFIERAPQAASLVISVNISVTQIGLAAGAALGGAAAAMNGTVLYNPWVASVALLLSFAAALDSIRRKKQACAKTH
ncbi:MAG: MFS transporter [Paenibacillaceae bacterium]|nr:MFS transporter [Paenibacillaceae bacterium]